MNQCEAILFHLLPYQLIYSRNFLNRTYSKHWHYWLKYKVIWIHKMKTKDSKVFRSVAYLIKYPVSKRNVEYVMHCFTDFASGIWDLNFVMINKQSTQNVLNFTSYIKQNTFITLLSSSLKFSYCLFSDIVLCIVLQWINTYKSHFIFLILCKAHTIFFKWTCYKDISILNYSLNG